MARTDNKMRGAPRGAAGGRKKDTPKATKAALEAKGTAGTKARKAARKTSKPAAKTKPAAPRRPSAATQRTSAALARAPARPAALFAASPWSVPPGQIKHWTDIQLTAAIRRLLIAEAHFCGADVSRVMVNTEEKARDEGCDAYSPAPARPSRWLGATATCWQLKAGGAGQPAKIAAEIGKPVPRKMLARGERFIVVASGSPRGEPARVERVQVLHDEARRLRLKTGAIDVLTSETLATWLEEHPAIAGEFIGLPPGVELLSEWARDPQHEGAWVPTTGQAARLAEISAGIDPIAGTVTHVHIFGRPGVGKTRFALELCRQAQWRESVLFVRQPLEVPVLQTIAAVGSAAEKRLVLVVDEVRPEQVAPWAAAAARADGRIRLVTIGHDPTIDGAGGEIQMEPLEPDTMAKVVRGWYPEMPPEHVDFVAQFADGYVRLARLAARAVKEKPDINVRELLQDRQVMRLMDNLLQAQIDDRRALHVVAVLNSVGWEGEREIEGRTIANHLGLDWGDVRARVHAFDKRLGIAPRAGDLRYISPSPLGVFLALEAWEIYRDRLHSLVTVLPNEAARREYHERLRAVMASPLAKEFAEEELRDFFSWERFTKELDVERWAALSLADPLGSAQRVAKALQDASREQRLQISGRARRHLVNALADLAWGNESFAPAMLALAELADAENETWGNNATGEFVSKFQMRLGGTARPYVRRLEVIDELLLRPETTYHALSIKALAQVGNINEHRAGPTPRLDAPREREWRPTTGEQLREAAREALKRLEAEAARGIPGLGGALEEAVRLLAMLLRVPEVREDAASLVHAVARAYPDSREAVGRAVADIAERETRYWKELSEGDLAWIAALENEIEDRSPAAQVRKLVGARVFREGPDLAPAADLILATPELLDLLWTWLTSGDAHRAWELGTVLARQDTDRALLSRLLDARNRGPDLRLIAGYLVQVLDVQGHAWLDDLLEDLLSRNSGEATFVLELTWRVPATERGARRIISAAEAGTLDGRLAVQLAFGGWSNSIPPGLFRDLVKVLARDSRYDEAALQLVEFRVSTKPEEWDALKPVALDLLGKPALVKAGGMTEHYWLELSRKVVTENGRAISKTLFAAHGEKDEKIWFLEHSQARAVLDACIEADALGVWHELRPHLEDPAKAARFIVGFPDGVINRLPHEAIMSWVAESPEQRAPFVARLVAHDLGNGGLGAKLLVGYRSVVSSTIMTAWATGSWWGDASAHWDQIAEALTRIAELSTERDVRSWAEGAARRFRKEAEQERKREAEEQVRGP